MNRRYFLLPRRGWFPLGGRLHRFWWRTLLAALDATGGPE